MDRPTFERLRNTMKEMEGNHKVRRVRETIMDTEGSFREEANDSSRTEAERSVLHLPPALLSQYERLIKY